MDELLVFGRGLLVPRSHVFMHYLHHPEVIPKITQFLHTLSLNGWMVPCREKIHLGINLRRHPRCLGILPLYRCNKVQVDTITIQDSLLILSLTNLYSYHLRASSRVKGCLSTAELFQETLPSLCAEAITTFYQYTGSDLLTQSRDVWEVELAYRLDDRMKELRLPRPGLFPITVAAALYNTYATRTLDCCAGWGDRLLAACITDTQYVGVDPSTQLHPVYETIIAAHGSSRQKVLCRPFEDMSPDELGMFDFVLTSPPFFDRETYVEEPDQSIMRYPNIETWKREFLFKSLQLIDRVVVPGGHVALHLVDIKDHNLVEPTLSYCRTLKWNLLGYMAYVTSGNKGLRRNEDGRIHGSPIWLFRKP